MNGNNKKNEILIFGGTTEGRRLVEMLSGEAYTNVHVTLCTATEYGGEVISDPGDNVSIRCQRLDSDEMESLLVMLKPTICIDATHPYAVNVSQNIAVACEKVGVECVRVLRDAAEYDEDKVMVVDSIEAAVRLLENTKGNILITTGSKEIEKFCSLSGFEERCYARVLPVMDSINKCHSCGIRADRIIAMQGPFSQKLNEVLIKAFNIEYMVTKESGSAGGFTEKIMAAEATGTSMVIVRRPEQKINQNTMFLSEMMERLKTEYSSSNEKCEKESAAKTTQVTLVGIGPGSVSEMTISSIKKLANSDLIIGASRMIAAAKEALLFCDGNGIERNINVRFKQIYDIEKISEMICESGDGSISVVFSGDVGFSSGALRLKKILEEKNICCDIVSGLSSLPIFFDRVGLPWERAKLMTFHGRDCAEGSITGVIATEHYVGILPKDGEHVQEICSELSRRGLGDVKVHVGERLSYEDEKLGCFSAGQLAKMPSGSFLIDTLSAVIFVNENCVPADRSLVGIRDDEFIREKNSRGNLIPMTKSEVRAVIMSKLCLSKASLLWDIGAGTGSVSIRAAAILEKGSVVSFEKNDEASDLFEKNVAKFGFDNIRLIRGDALDGISEIGDARPTHVFLGGTSGEMSCILEKLAEMKRSMRVVASAVTLETLAEITRLARVYSKDTEPDIVQLGVSRSKKLGEHSLMQAENPVYIVSFDL